ncbi:molecular chaperone DnaJ [Mycobacteroides chelonae]|uniref:molecular chaperone DnaJ n=1 Tax=Mycobacteroides chelonae TaxID=1774 RepID=UPI001F1F125D|nr:molecular chaperone DnaJ [Mycobacteroides chelonae]
MLEIALREQDFRVDGLPRANARPEHPGVILNITTAHKGHLRFPCDRFKDWHDNLRAIALALEALRKVDRYGVTQHGEQYAGWRAIESAGSGSSMSAEAAERIVRRVAGDSGGDLVKVVRLARARAHPDRHGGSRVHYDEVDCAVQVLTACGRIGEPRNGM